MTTAFNPNISLYGPTTAPRPFTFDPNQSAVAGNYFKSIPAYNPTLYDGLPTNSFTPFTPTTNQIFPDFHLGNTAVQDNALGSANVANTMNAVNPGVSGGYLQSIKSGLAQLGHGLETAVGWGGPTNNNTDGTGAFGKTDINGHSGSPFMPIIGIAQDVMGFINSIKAFNMAKKEMNFGMNVTRRNFENMTKKYNDTKEDQIRAAYAMAGDDPNVTKDKIESDVKKHKLNEKI